MIRWKKISEIREPMNDAYNYRGRGSKDFFSKIFLRTEELSRCLDPNIYYLIGEKGAGKTAYAVYLENNPTESHSSKLTSMTETQYKRFIELKKNNKLAYSDYANIWRSMLLFIISQMLIEREKNFLHTLSGKFKKLEGELLKWTTNAMTPEVESAFEAVKEMGFNLEGTIPNLKSQVNGKQSSAEKSSQLKHHLLALEQSFKEALAELNLKKSHALFIDGIDFKPEGIAHKEYIECIKCLGEAAWQLNTDFFSGIRDSKGRIKICLLVRPDVLNSLNLYNSNSRIQDNSILLDWATVEEDHQNSKLYELCDRFLSSQQSHHPSLSQSWNQYFSTPNEPNKVFKQLLRSTFQKPRDFLTFIKIAKQIEIKNSNGDADSFSQSLISSAAFSSKFSDYLLGEVKNYFSFYMSQEDFNKYIKFFQYLNGKLTFTTQQFSEAFQRFKAWADGEDFNTTHYLRDEEALLQLFYDVNLIGYLERSTNSSNFYHWAYRERTLNNIAPKVKYGADLILNPGIAKALDVGSRVNTVVKDSVRIVSAKKEQASRIKHRRRNKNSENG